MTIKTQLKNTSIIGIALACIAPLSPAIASDGKAVADKSDGCTSNISSKKNLVELINCDKVDIDVQTDNGSKISVNSSDGKNTVIVQGGSNSSASVTQSGQGNSVVVIQSGGTSTRVNSGPSKTADDLRKEFEKEMKLRLKALEARKRQRKI